MAKPTEAEVAGYVAEEFPRWPQLTEMGRAYAEKKFREHGEVILEVTKDSVRTGKPSKKDKHSTEFVRVAMPFLLSDDVATLGAPALRLLMVLIQHDAMKSKNKTPVPLSLSSDVVKMMGVSRWTVRRAVSEILAIKPALIQVNDNGPGKARKVVLTERGRAILHPR